MRRKVFSWFLAVLMVSSLLGGCSSEEVVSEVDTGVVEEVQEDIPEVVENTPEDIVLEEIVVEATPEVSIPKELVENNISSISLEDIPEYSGEAYYVVNDNNPFFNESELSSISFEQYSELDVLGRCGVCVASVGKDIMPTEDRGSIGSVKPTGWQTVKYDCVDGKYLYNRCHLIGFQLTGENANTKNLITGTRYLNIDGMLPFENMVDDYVEETNNHVMYRVTPMYMGEELVARGVLMEGYSVEDSGEGICFNVFCYNVQPGVSINYVDGSSYLLDVVDVQEEVPVVSTTDNSDSVEAEEEKLQENQIAEEPEEGVMVWKSATGEKYHSRNNCGRMNPSKATEITKERAESMGLDPCSKCF